MHENNKKKTENEKKIEKRMGVRKKSGTIRKYKKKGEKKRNYTNRRSRLTVGENRKRVTNGAQALRKKKERHRNKKQGRHDLFV